MLAPAAFVPTPLAPTAQARGDGMPFASDAQRKMIFARARAGEAWAKKFIADSRRSKVRRKKRIAK